MSKEIILKFYEELGKNRELFERFKNLDLAHGQRKELIISFARQAGFDFSSDDSNENIIVQ